MTVSPRRPARRRMVRRRRPAGARRGDRLARRASPPGRPAARPAGAERVALAGPSARFSTTWSAAVTAGKRCASWSPATPVSSAWPGWPGPGCGRPGSPCIPLLRRWPWPAPGLGLAWDDAVVVSAHGRPLAPAVEACGPRPEGGGADAPRTTRPRRSVGRLLAAGCGARDVIVASRLGEPDEDGVDRRHGRAGRRRVRSACPW